MTGTEYEVDKLHRHEDELTATTFDNLFRLVNALSSDHELMLKLSSKVIGEHRTLQQSFMRLMQGVITAYANYHQQNPHAHDPRNRAAVQWCKAVSAINHPLPLI